MSFTDITRNCFQSGISANRWLHLCKTYVSQNPMIESDEDVAKQISNSVLVLYQSYPADPGLNSYLKSAIEDGILPLPVYVSTFLEASGSSELNSAATLDFLCELAVTMHEESGHLPLGSLISSTENPLKILLNVLHCLGLIQLSYSIALSRRHHKLIENSGKLLIHLLSCVNDMSQVTIAEAWKLYTAVGSVLREAQLDMRVRGLLESFMINLSMILEDEPKAAREAQIIQSMQMAKGDVGGPNSENDIITLGLLWQYLVIHRAHEFGAGSTKHAVALLVSTWRWSAWSAQVFYTQVFVSAFSCLSSKVGRPLLWKAFIVGRLPTLLAAFQASISSDPSIDWRGALYHGLRAAFRRPDLIVAGDHFLAQGIAPGSNDEFRSSYTHELLQHLAKLELIDQVFALELDPSLANQSGSHSMSLFDAFSDAAGADVTSAFELKLAQEMESGEKGWFDRIPKDVGAHPILASWVLKRFSTCSKALDVESLSQLCKLLYTHHSALDLVALHVKVSDLIFHSLLFLDDFDCETVGDPQTAVAHLGNVVLFVQYALSHFQLERDVYIKDHRSLSVEFLRHTHEIFPVDSLPTAEAASFHSWFKALFDSSSEGIEDSILRSSHPKILLRISATLFSQAIKAVSAQKIDAETLLNGVSYFTGPLLNWTLVGVIKALIREAQLSRNPTPATLDILQTLLVSQSCPRPVLALCRTSVLRYLADKPNGIPGSPSFNVAAVQHIVREAGSAAGCLRNPNGTSNNSNTVNPNRPPGPTLSTTPTATAGAPVPMTGPNRIQMQQQYPRDKIRAAMAMSHTHKIIEFDIDRCLKIVTPTKFLAWLWGELTIAAASSMGGRLEVCRRVSTYILTMPRSSTGGGAKGSPPLLPVFMHLILPAFLTPIESAASGDQMTPMIELITTIIFSSLTAALHLEWSLATLLEDEEDGVISGGALPPVLSESGSNTGIAHNSNSKTVVLGASSSAIARRLASDLRSRKDSQMCSLILQRLSSSQSFVANFPYFGAELG